MSAHPWFKKLERVLVIVAIAMLGAGLWFEAAPAADLSAGQPGPNLACQSDDPVLLAPISSVADLTHDGKAIYWLTRGNPGQVMKMSKSSGQIQVLADLQGEPYNILVDNKSVYWVESISQPDFKMSLEKTRKQGGRVVNLWQTTGRIAGISMDASHLYWGDYESKSLLRLSKKGGQPKVLVSGEYYFPSVIHQRVYLGSKEALGVMGRRTPKTLVTAERIIQELHIGLRDGVAIYTVWPALAEYNKEIIFEFYVANNPGWISCTDNWSYIVGLSKVTGNLRLIGKVGGGAEDIRAVAGNLYLHGACHGAEMINIETGAVSTIGKIGYNVFRLLAGKNFLYWTDQEGLKCMRRPQG